MIKRSLIVIALGLVFVGIVRFLEPPVGQTNILVLGVAGENQIGADLTDTMIFVSLDHNSGKTLLLSLPRDIWIASLRTKLNSVYHYQGMAETKKILSEILGQPVNYGVVINFTVFKKIVDSLGGVIVEVERSFDDYKYPIAGKEKDDCGGDKNYQCRYEHIRFEVGLQKMDGETALKYVRSRNAEGDEGTDFARSQRQQQLILAIKNKVLSPRFFLDFRRPLQLIKVVSWNIKSDIPSEKYVDFFKIALRIRSKNIKTAVLNNGYLINPPVSEKYDRQWVLVPQSGSWEEIQEFVNQLYKF